MSWTYMRHLIVVVVEVVVVVVAIFSLANQSVFLGNMQDNDPELGA